jgi:hypothetical protein
MVGARRGVQYPFQQESGFFNALDLETEGGLRSFVICRVKMVLKLLFLRKQLIPFSFNLIGGSHSGSPFLSSRPIISKTASFDENRRLPQMKKKPLRAFRGLAGEGLNY